MDSFKVAFHQGISDPLPSEFVPASQKDFGLPWLKENGVAELGGVEHHSRLHVARVAASAIVIVFDPRGPIVHSDNFR